MLKKSISNFGKIAILLIIIITIIDLIFIKPNTGELLITIAWKSIF